MPGKTIGKQFNPMPELVWRARVTIQKVAGEHEVYYEHEDGDPATRKIVREHIDKAIEEIRKRL
jgi:hypothetical protein